MNILCITPWFPSHCQDHKGSFIFDSMKALSELGHNVVILYTIPYKLFIKKLYFNDTVFTIYKCYYLSIPRNYGRALSNFLYCKIVMYKINKLFTMHQFDLIHAQTELAGIAGINAGKKYRIPVVVTIHGIDSDAKLLSTNGKYKYASVLNDADRIILVGDPLVNYFKNLANHHDHFRVVLNGFRLNFLNLAYLNKINTNNKIKFISVSNLNDGKGIDINIYALSKLNAAGHTNWHYTIIGNGNKKESLKKIVCQLNLTDKIQFINYCNHHEIFFHLTNATIFILPSKPEAFGIAYLEAMSCGVLCIAVAEQGPSHFITHNETGILIEKNDAKTLYEALIIILSSPIRMRTIADAGKKHVHTYFTWKHHANNLINVYNELTN